MNKENVIIKMLALLKKNNIYATPEFEKSLVKLVTTNIVKFVEVFYKDIRIENIEEYNKHEKLKLTKKQKQDLGGLDLYRYECRINSNLKCIYIVINENNIRKTILLNAFNEDGDKTKGKNSYRDNINKSIGIYLNILQGGIKNGN